MEEPPPEPRADLSQREWRWTATAVSWLAGGFAAVDDVGGRAGDARLLTAAALAVGAARRVWPEAVLEAVLGETVAGMGEKL